MVMISEFYVFKMKLSFSTGKSFCFQYLCFKRFKTFRSSHGKSGFQYQCNNISNLPNLFFPHRLFPTEFPFTMFYKLRVFLPLREEEILQNQTFTETKNCLRLLCKLSLFFSHHWCLSKYCKSGTLLKLFLLGPLPITLPIFQTSACV